MAKEISGYVKLQIKGGQANPAPPVGPELGQRGINIMEFCKAFNDKTKSFAGKPVPVIITVYKDKKFDFVIKYWDIRFSNLCNLACRSCGTWFSSNWYEDHKKLTGKPPDHAKIMKVGRSSDDIWDQMLKHIDHVEQFYFAGQVP